MEHPRGTPIFMPKRFFKKPRKTTCSRCGEPNDREGQAYCTKCHAAESKEYRQRRTEKLRMLSQLLKEQNV